MISCLRDLISIKPSSALKRKRPSEAAFFHAALFNKMERCHRMKNAKQALNL